MLRHGEGFSRWALAFVLVVFVCQFGELVTEDLPAKAPLQADVAGVKDGEPKKSVPANEIRGPVVRITVEYLVYFT